MKMSDDGGLVNGIVGGDVDGGAGTGAALLAEFAGTLAKKAKRSPTAIPFTSLEVGGGVRGVVGGGVGEVGKTVGEAVGAAVRIAGGAVVGTKLAHVASKSAQQSFRSRQLGSQ